ncbi:hypothetical protein FBQ97_03440 [Acidobacteria bacterium ACD]|nr:hypothetical protein [Acidobacteria bacterium ACD]
MRTGKWIELASEGSGSERVKVKDISVILRISPYDIPDAVRGLYHQDSGRLQIELRYIGEEPTKKVALANGAELVLGKHSGRLYGLWLPVAPPGLESNCEVNVRVERITTAAFASAEKGLPHGAKLRNRNLELAKRAILGNVQHLVEGAASREATA